MECARCAIVLQSATLPSRLSSYFGSSTASISSATSSVTPRLNSGTQLRIISLLDGKQSKSRNRRRLSIPRCAGSEVFTAEKESVVTKYGHGDDSELWSPDVGSEKSDQKFDWLAQWYPVAVLKHMDKRQPQSVTILGRDLVMWWDGAGSQWQVFADACPHRMAPLSEGRINEQGHLQCSYHGWSFASSGACTLIPQAPKEKAQQFISSKRACAKVYLSQHHQGMLWVFMDISPGSTERALAKPPPLLPHLDDPEYVFDVSSSDVSYSYEALVENLVDPSHFPFAHHGIQGSRKSGKPLDLSVSEISKDGITGDSANVATFKFLPPSLTFTDVTLPKPIPPTGNPVALKLQEWIITKPWRLCITFICVPTVPGKSKLFFIFPRNFARIFFKWTPRWWTHLVQMKLLDSDMYLLHTLDRRIEDAGGFEKIEKLYYTPTKADAFVVAFRKWLKRFGVPDYGPKTTDRLPPIEGKRVALDRNLHVLQCTTCSGALRKFRALEVVSQVLPLTCMVLAAASNTRSLARLSPFRIPILCLAIISFFASKWFTHWINKEYVFHDYNHALVK